MSYNIPNVLLVTAIVVPVAFFAIGSFRGKEIYQMSEIGLSALILVILSVVTACVQSATAGYDAQQFLPTWIVGGVFAVMTMTNAMQVLRMKDRFALETISGDDPGFDEIGRKSDTDLTENGQARVVTVQRACCTSAIAVKPMESDDKLKQSDPLKDLALFLPLVTLNFFRIEIAFTEKDDGVSVVAASSAKIRPWYTSLSFFMFVPIIQRDTKASAEASVTCTKRGDICVAMSAGDEGDTSSENECQSAAAVDVKLAFEPNSNGDADKPKVDPTKIILVPKGVVTFKGSGTFEDIKIEVKPTEGVTLSTTINTPSAPDIKEVTTRPITFQCSPQVEKEVF